MRDVYRENVSQCFEKDALLSYLDCADTWLRCVHERRPLHGVPNFIAPLTESASIPRQSEVKRDHQSDVTYLLLPHLWPGM